MLNVFFGQVAIPCDHLFFSSRRRHTRLQGDWSSDVCSSDLIFSISGRGTVVTGRIERGKVKVSEEIEIVGFRATQKKVVTGVEMFKKLLDEGLAGEDRKSVV